MPPRNTNPARPHLRSISRRLAVGAEVCVGLKDTHNTMLTLLPREWDTQNSQKLSQPYVQLATEKPWCEVLEAYGERPYQPT